MMKKEHLKNIIYSTISRTCNAEYIVTEELNCFVEWTHDDENPDDFYTNIAIAFGESKEQALADAKHHADT